MSSRILKGDGVGQSPEPGGPRTAAGSKVVKQDIFAANQDAKQILEAARAEAQARVDAAQAEADAIREAARAKGYEDGITELNELALRFQERQAQLLEESRAELIRLSVRIAGKVLGRELETNADALSDIVIRAIRGIRHEKRIQVRVHPDDLGRARAGHARLLEEVGATKEIEFREDPTVTSGGCIVETDLGIIDARLDTQLRVLEKALLSRKP